MRMGMFWTKFERVLKMDNRQALGYMLLACKELGMSNEQAKKLYSAMYNQFDFKTESEAEEQGFAWYHNLKDAPEEWEKLSMNTDRSYFYELVDKIPEDKLEELRIVLLKMAIPEVEASEEELIAIQRGKEQFERGEFTSYKSFEEMERDLLND